MKTHRVKWSVSLSNGETYHEEKGDYCTVEAELSPWQRLLAYIAEQNVKITSLYLRTDDGRTYNLPSAGNNPRFKAFGDSQKPVDYNMHRRVAVDVMNGKQGLETVFTIARATLNDGKKMEIWVNEETLNSWVLVI